MNPSVASTQLLHRVERASAQGSAVAPCNTWWNPRQPAMTISLRRQQLEVIPFGPSKEKPGITWSCRAKTKRNRPLLCDIARTDTSIFEAETLPLSSKGKLILDMGAVHVFPGSCKELGNFTCLSQCQHRSCGSRWPQRYNSDQYLTCGCANMDKMD